MWQEQGSAESQVPFHSPYTPSIHTYVCPSCSIGPGRLSQFSSRDYSSASMRWGSCSTKECPQLMTAPSTTTTCYQAGVMVRDWTEAGGHRLT